MMYGPRCLRYLNKFLFCFARLRLAYTFIRTRYLLFCIRSASRTPPGWPSFRAGLENKISPYISPSSFLYSGCIQVTQANTGNLPPRRPHRPSRIHHLPTCCSICDTANWEARYLSNQNINIHFNPHHLSWITLTSPHLKQPTPRKANDGLLPPPRANTPLHLEAPHLLQHIINNVARLHDRDNSPCTTTAPQSDKLKRLDRLGMFILCVCITKQKAHLPYPKKCLHHLRSAHGPVPLWRKGFQ